jgi:hypothetical protein
MNITRLQGWALMVGLPVALLSLIPGDAPWFGILSLISVILFIFGVPAVRSVQSMGTAGLVGIILVVMAAVIALWINLLGGPEFSEVLIATSVIAGASGRLIIGWLTANGSVFPEWAGWAFLLQGIINLIGYLFLFDLGTFGASLGTIGYLLDSAALFGFGWVIARS